MKNPEKIEQIVNLLKESDIDKETMEDILEQVGLREHVIGQILDSEKYIIAKKTWDDIFGNETLTYNNFEDYYTDKYLS